jgi:hypothetical protein
MNAERKKEYRLLMSDYQKAKYLEYLRKQYHNLTPEKKQELCEKRRKYYEANRERIRKYQSERYHLVKDMVKKNN